MQEEVVELLLPTSRDIVIACVVKCVQGRSRVIASFARPPIGQSGSFLPNIEGPKQARAESCSPSKAHGHRMHTRMSHCSVELAGEMHITLRGCLSKTDSSLLTWLHLDRSPA